MYDLNRRNELVYFKSQFLKLFKSVSTGKSLDLRIETPTTRLFGSELKALIHLATMTVMGKI